MTDPNSSSSDLDDSCWGLRNSIYNSPNATPTAVSHGVTSTASAIIASHPAVSVLHSALGSLSIPFSGPPSQPLQSQVLMLSTSQRPVSLVQPTQLDLETMATQPVMLETLAVEQPAETPTVSAAATSATFIPTEQPASSRKRKADSSLDKSPKRLSTQTAPVTPNPIQLTGIVFQSNSDKNSQEDVTIPASNRENSNTQGSGDSQGSGDLLSSGSLDLTPIAVSRTQRNQTPDTVSPASQRATGQSNASVSHSQQAGPSSSNSSTTSTKIVTTSDGRRIPYSYAVYFYYNYADEIVYRYQEGHGSITQTQASSDYFADSSGCSKSSLSSQEMILKSHRSAEDNLNVAPVHLQRKPNSQPPCHQLSRQFKLPELPSHGVGGLVHKKSQSELTGSVIPTSDPSNVAAVPASVTQDSANVTPNSSAPVPQSAAGSACLSIHLSDISSVKEASLSNITSPGAVAPDSPPLSMSTEPLQPPVRLPAPPPAQPPTQSTLSPESFTVAVEPTPEPVESIPGLVEPVIAEPTYPAIDPPISPLPEIGLTRLDKQRSRRPKRPRRFVLPRTLDDGESISPMRPAMQPEVLPRPPPGALVVNARVVARWPTDRFYYTGRVERKQTLNKWSVLFDDGNTAAIPSRDILVCDKLPRGHTIMAKAGERGEEYLPSTIIEVFNPNGSLSGATSDFLYEYRVEYLEDGTQARISTVDICLDRAQYTSLQYLLEQQQETSEESQTSQGASSAHHAGETTPAVRSAVETAQAAQSSTRLSRIARTTSKSPCAAPAVAKSPRAAAAKLTRAPRNTNQQSVSIVPRKASTPTETRQSSRLQEKVFTDLQKSPVRKVRPNKDTPVKGDSSCTTISFTDEVSLRELTASRAGPSNPVLRVPAPSRRSVTGPDGLPLPPHEMFVGCVFLVTRLKNDPLIHEIQNRGEITELSDNTETDTPSSNGATPAAVDRQLICDHITKLGGLVLDQYDEDAMGGASHRYLISDTMQRTVKYLQCLAANIPPVSYSWIELCYRSQQYYHHKDYLLPAGADIMSRQLVEWREHEALAGASFFLAASNSNSTFTGDWKIILRLADAHVVPKMSSSSGIRPDYMLMDVTHGCPQHMKTQARRMGIPIVTSEWVIQCLITGERRPLHLHPSFLVPE